jgi:hypothetical protein
MRLAFSIMAPLALVASGSICACAAVREANDLFLEQKKKLDTELDEQLFRIVHDYRDALTDLETQTTGRQTVPALHQNTEQVAERSNEARSDSLSDSEPAPDSERYPEDQFRRDSVVSLTAQRDKAIREYDAAWRKAITAADQERQKVTGPTARPGESRANISFNVEFARQVTGFQNGGNGGAYEFAFGAEGCTGGTFEGKIALHLLEGLQELGLMLGGRLKFNKIGRIVPFVDFHGGFAALLYPAVIENPDPGEEGDLENRLGLGAVIDGGLGVDLMLADSFGIGLIAQYWYVLFDGGEVTFLTLGLHIEGLL